MTGIEELISKYGIAIPEEKQADFIKEFHSNYKSVAEVEKKDAKITALTDRVSKAEEALKNFDGVDPDKFNEEIARLKTQLEEADKVYKEDLYKRDFEDALNKELSKIKFTSNMAKKAVTEQMRSANLTLQDGKIYGFQDKLAEIREAEADAFVNEEKEKLENEKVRFTDPMGAENAPKVSLDDYYKLAKGEERRAFIQANPSLFARK